MVARNKGLLFAKEQNLKHFFIGVVIGLGIAWLGMALVHFASIPTGYEWLALLFIGSLVGLAMQWGTKGINLVSLGAGLMLALGIAVLIHWKVPAGILPTISGSGGFLAGAAIRTYFGNKKKNEMPI